MANASAEKLKALGLRHGEKAVVGLAAALCLLFVAKAITNPTIDLSPEDVSKSAAAAEANINRRQEPNDILAKLEENGIKNPGFEKMVDEQQKNLLDPNAFKSAQLWVSPEPGAGLIRDTPELIAVADLYAYPGRGAALIWELDENNNRIPAPKEQPPDEAAKARRGKKKRRPSMMMSSSMQSSMGSGMSGAPTSKKEEEAQKKQREIEERRLKGAFVGKAGQEKAAEQPAAPAEEGPYKEITKGLRWVTITGTLDNKKLKENYLTALKKPEVAYPHFKQVNVERQMRQPDGSWSEWEKVDREKNLLILDNIPEEEEELTPETVRLASLVDPLPFLKAGYWERVHVVSLVPKEKRELAPQAGSGFGGSMMGGSSGDYARQMQMQQQQQMSMQTSSSSAMGSSSMMSMEGGPGAAVEDTNFPKSEADTLMVRSLDFTVEPDQTYRFRVQLVVFNPNYNRQDISPGVDNKNIELKGDWSEPTQEVTMPPDVAAYAMKKVPPAGKRTDLVTFQVTRWSPDTGVTVVRTFDASPGEIIGELRSTDVPVSDGSGKKPMKIDFNSHEIVLDTMGGYQKLPPVGIVGADLAIPASTLLVRPDGAVVLRNQADDVNDAVRKDTESNYNRELKESDKQRESSNGGSSMMSMSRQGP